MGFLSFFGIEVVVAGESNMKSKLGKEYPCDFCGSNCGQCGISGPTENNGKDLLSRAAVSLTKRKLGS